MTYLTITFGFIRHHRSVDQDDLVGRAQWHGLEPGSLRPAPKPPGGVAVLLVREERVLLGLRAPGRLGAGTWAPPGGKAESDEGSEECARRELLEETGLWFGEFSAVGVVSDRCEDGRPWETLFVLAAWVGGEPQVREPDACVEWRWFPSAQLPAPLFRPFDRLISLAGWPLRTG